MDKKRERVRLLFSLSVLYVEMSFSLVAARLYRPTCPLRRYIAGSLY